MSKRNEEEEEVKHQTPEYAVQTAVWKMVCGLEEKMCKMCFVYKKLVNMDYVRM